jgi:hypothetical protein
MSDSINDPIAASAATGATDASQPVAFCQDCGRPLTRETMRSVGTGVFCEPCLQVRLSGYVPGAVPPPNGPVGAMPPVPGEPSPTLAGFLGLIPGVGAMYNGQFAKGIAHIAIFAILMSLGDHVSGLFGIMAAGWIFYQVFDAIHTARARRDGLPVPNTFGLNDIGDRVGYGRSWNPPVQPAPPTAPPAASQPYAAAPAQPWADVTAASTTVPPPSPAAYANWAGYVPPTAFAGTTPPPPPSPSSFAGAPVAETPYTAPYAYTPDAAAIPPMPPVRRFPVAAVVLIVFGVLFLIANIVPSWHFGERWVVPLLLAVWAAWMLARRLSTLDEIRTTSAISGRPWVVAVIRFPLILATLSLMWVLHDLDVATIGQTWPLILIVWGGLALVDRAGVYTPHPVHPVSTSIVPPVSGAAPESPRADFTSQGDAR